MTAITPFRIRVILSAFLSIAAFVLGPSARAADFRVGFVNVAEVLEEAPQAEDARGRIEREFAPKDRELLGQQKEIRKLEDKLVRDGAVMAESERQKLDREIRTMKREFRRSQEEFREDLNLRRNEEQRELLQGVIEATQALGKSEKYDLILTDGVIFAGDGVDITQKVIDRLKADFESSKKVGGGRQ